MTTNTGQGHPETTYGMYVIVWLALVVLTSITVGVSYLNMRNAAVLLAVMIATVKVLIVLLYFMHVRFEKPIVRYMITTAVIIYGIFFGLTMSDYWYR